MDAPTDPFALLQYHMIKAHNVLKLGFDNILEHLENPPTTDIYNFIGYCQAWADSLHGHHDSEEAVVFPKLNEKLDFSGEQEQHKVIHKFLTEYLEYIHQVQADTSKFDAEKLKEMMIAVREPLIQHLDEEVEHIAPETLKIFDEEEIKKLNQDMAAYSKSHGDPFTILVFMRAHTPPEFKDTWPRLPWFLRKLLIPYVFAQRYSGYWKYAPYATS